jgi:uncharacterized protein YeaO (DUF488 family)
MARQLGPLTPFGPGRSGSVARERHFACGIHERCKVRRRAGKVRTRFAGLAASARGAAPGSAESRSPRAGCQSTPKGSAAEPQSRDGKQARATDGEHQPTRRPMLQLHMLSRYRIVRGARPVDEPLPNGIRQDTRKHTRHILRPSPEIVAQLLSDASPESFARFRKAYLSLLDERFLRDRGAFDTLAQLARREDVYLGCNCPSARQPEVRRCHTVLALEFFAAHYADLQIRID